MPHLCPSPSSDCISLRKSQSPYCGLQASLDACPWAPRPFLQPHWSLHACCDQQPAQALGAGSFLCLVHNPLPHQHIFPRLILVPLSICLSSAFSRCPLHTTLSYMVKTAHPGHTSSLPAFLPSSPYSFFFPMAQNSFHSNFLIVFHSMTVLFCFSLSSFLTHPKHLAESGHSMNNCSAKNKQNRCDLWHQEGDGPQD